MSARLTLVLVSMVAACGGDDGGGAVDAAPTVDASMVTVMRIDPCPATVDATVVTMSANAFVPAAQTITVGQTVKFTMNAAHDTAALPGTDATLDVPLGGERCFKFLTKGVAKFKCRPHGFTGMITVN